MGQGIPRAIFTVETYWEHRIQVESDKIMMNTFLTDVLFKTLMSTMTEEKNMIKIFLRPFCMVLF
jgi:hypothetical protein